jgi:UDP-N-acetylglucosamine--N-acetylmuramyl-(pentapeptide) pyrophosphoryl-undecaprenol N-acetylglucosamine transferase
MKKTVFISAGSSGGHIYPAITLAKKLREQGHVVFFIATSNRIEGKIIPPFGFEILDVTSPVVRKPFKGMMKFISEIVRSIKESNVHVKKHRPDFIVSFGGAVSFSIGFVAFYNRIPLFVHEQNAVVGLSNEWIALFATKVLTQFKIKSKLLSHKMVHVGSPRTSEFKNYKPNDSIYHDLGFDPNKPLVVFVMGSLGSFTMQSMIERMINHYPECDFQRLIITGSRFFENFTHVSENSSGTKIVESISLIDLYPHIDLLVTRAGATTMAELLGSQTPSILIPSPYVTRNHQFENAKYFVEHQVAQMLDERILDEHQLHQSIDSLLKQPQKLLEMKQLLANMSDLNELNLLMEQLPL